MKQFIYTLSIYNHLSHLEELNDTIFKHAFNYTAFNHCLNMSRNEPITRNKKTICICELKMKNELILYINKNHEYINLANMPNFKNPINKQLSLIHI